VAAATLTSSATASAAMPAAGEEIRSSGEGRFYAACRGRRMPKNEASEKVAE